MTTEMGADTLDLALPSPECVTNTLSSSPPPTVLPSTLHTPHFHITADHVALISLTCASREVIPLGQ